VTGVGVECGSYVSYLQSMARKDELSFWFEGGENCAQFSAIVTANGFSGETGYVTFPSDWQEFWSELLNIRSRTQSR